MTGTKEPRGAKFGAPCESVELPDDSDDSEVCDCDDADLELDLALLLLTADEDPRWEDDWPLEEEEPDGWLEELEELEELEDLHCAHVEKPWKTGGGTSGFCEAALILE